MAVSLAGKVCLVTGASNGIGAATAVTFAKLGGLLAITGRSVEGLQKTVEQCKKVSQVDVHTIVADLAVAADRERIVAETIKHFNKLDVLINNAGVFAPGNVEAPNLIEVYDSVMEINTK